MADFIALYQSLRFRWRRGSSGFWYL